MVYCIANNNNNNNTTTWIIKYRKRRYFQAYQLSIDKNTQVLNFANKKAREIYYERMRTCSIFFHTINHLTETKFNHSYFLDGQNITISQLVKIKLDRKYLCLR